MKFGICCTFIVLAVIGTIGAQQTVHQYVPGDNPFINSSVFNNIITFYQEKIKNRCQHQSHVYQQFSRHSDQLRAYGSFAFSLLPQDQERFCSEERPHLLGLLQVILDDFRQCVSEHEEYLAEFAYTTAGQALDLLCENDGANIQMLFDYNARPCLTALQSASCTSDFVNIPVLYNTNKEQYCQKLLQNANCTQLLYRNYSHECRNYPHLVDFANALMERITCVCGECPPLSGAGPLALGAGLLALPLLGALLHAA